MKTKEIEFESEYTDTFGGEANYSWVRRRKFTAPADASDRTVMRRARAAHDFQGVRGRWETLGETLAFYPSGSCTVLFVNPVY